MANPFRDRNEFYEIETPKAAPLRFSTDGFLRLATKATCRKCGYSFLQVCRTPRFREDFSKVGVLVKKDDPSQELVAASFIQKVCNNGLGNMRMHLHRFKPDYKRPGLCEVCDDEPSSPKHTAMRDCPNGDPKMRGKYLVSGVSRS